MNWHVPGIDPTIINDNGWQPIETAPKDGTGILAWDGNEMYLVWWAYDSWKSTSCVDGYTTMYNATNWMPLPSPP